MHILLFLLCFGMMGGGGGGGGSSKKKKGDSKKKKGDSKKKKGDSGNTSTVYGSITVTAVDSSNNPVSGNDWGFVLFKNGSYVKEVGGQTHTYTFTNLLAGTYKIDVYDYATYKNSKDNIILGDGESKSVKITVQ
jgi:hypothetical protein